MHRPSAHHPLEHDCLFGASLRPLLPQQAGWATRGDRTKKFFRGLTFCPSSGLSRDAQGRAGRQPRLRGAHPVQRQTRQKTTGREEGQRAVALESRHGSQSGLAITLARATIASPHHHKEVSHGVEKPMPHPRLGHSVCPLSGARGPLLGGGGDGPQALLFLWRVHLLWVE